MSGEPRPRCFSCLDWDSRPHTHRQGEVTVGRAGSSLWVMVWNRRAEVGEEYLFQITRRDSERLAVTHFSFDETGAKPTPPGHFMELAPEDLEALLTLSSATPAGVGSSELPAERQTSFPPALHHPLAAHDGGRASGAAPFTREGAAAYVALMEKEARG